MRLLVFADLHCNKSAIKELVRKSVEADIVVCAGDISNFGIDWRLAARLLSKMNKEMLIIPSNHDSEETIAAMERQFSYVRSIHKKVYQKDHVVFFGYGNHGFSLQEPGMEKTAKKLLKNMKFGKDEKFVFVTHAPPYNTKLDYLPWLRDHRGCMSAREVIEQFQPTLVVCGHFHETSGKQQKLGKSLLVNPGPEGKLITL